MSLFDVTGSLLTMVTHADRTVHYADPPIQEENFEWSGAFPLIAADTTELLTYLGMDGSVSVDIAEDSSHLWQMEDGFNPHTADIGTLADQWSNFQGGGTDTSYATDVNYGGGTRDVMSIGQTGNIGRQQSSDNVLQKIPTAKDGTKSFLVGGIMQIDGITGVQSFSNLVNQFKQGGNGWTFSARSSGSAGFDMGYFQFGIQQNNWTQIDNCRTIVADGGQPQAGVNFGEPFAFLCGLDVAAGQIFCMVSTSIGMAFKAWADVGAFDSSDRALRIGQADWFGAEDSFEGKVAQLFTLEWSAALDAEITQANMENFLKYCDGFLTI